MIRLHPSPPPDRPPAPRLIFWDADAGYKSVQQGPVKIKPDWASVEVHK